MKLVLPDVKHRWKNYICNRKRNELRTLTQIVTAGTPYCEKCGEEQTSIHVMTMCPGLAGPHTAILGKPGRVADDLKNFSIDKILKFAKQRQYWQMN